MAAPLQRIRGIYERIVIDNAAPVPVYAENQTAVDFEALDEYCFVRVNFGLIQAPVIGAQAQWHIRGSVICEIFTRKGIGPGRGMQIAAPIIEALSALNGPIPPATQEIIARVGPVTGPTQAQLQDRSHHFTRFSMPLVARHRSCLAIGAWLP
jgi:hypothetical protein